MSSLAAVITTIQPPTNQVRGLLTRLAPLNAKLIVAGDSKGPDAFDLPGVLFLPLAEQKNSAWRLTALLGEGHYARKNIAYLTAAAMGMRLLYETDDDTVPTPQWRLPSEHLVVHRIQAQRWANVYRLFSTELCWPRGLPLAAIHGEIERREAESVWAPVQQGLIDGNTDVDAIWRLLWSHPVHFDAEAAPVHLPAGLWCPFNSQNTWWFEAAFHLLYLPFHCSFRMTDIWRGFIAQRCLWAMGANLVFLPPDAFQVRNPHNLMIDFEQEVPGYLGNHKLVEILEDLSLERGTTSAPANLVACYRGLIAAGFLPHKELALVEAFAADMTDALEQGRKRAV